MGIGCGVDDDELNIFGRGCLDAVDQLTFVVALEGLEQQAIRARPAFHGRMDIAQRRATVDFGFAGSQQVQIRPVQDENSALLDRF